MFRLSFFILSLLTVVAGDLFAQTTVIYGVVRNDAEAPIPFANVVVNSGDFGTVSTDNGRYTIALKKNQTYKVTVLRSGYVPYKSTITVNNQDSILLNFQLQSVIMTAITVEDKGGRSSMKRIESKVSAFVPSPSGDFINAVLSSQPGVSMRNELSSSYSVRGGSYDENLIYVNDIEIYRPFLVRAGQQEGLSFINGDLVQKVSFSAGGFDAKYGDKLASVLDIQYRKPTKFAGSVQGGLLGGSFHLENASKSGKTTYIAGVRYRSNGYLLGSLDTKGEYKPRYADFQTYITHQFNPRLSLGFLGNYSSNRYNFIPQTRQTELGSIQQALRFTVFFDGQELSKYHTGLAAVDLNYLVTDEFRLKLILSQFYTSEREEYDIVGQYSLDEVERDFGADNFGNIARNLGVGGYLDHARNKLTGDVKSVNVKGYASILNHYLQFGVGGQYEKITDRLNEYSYVDSADFSIPQRNDGLLTVNEIVRANNNLQSYRLNAFVQDNYVYLNDNNDELRVNAGVRANYWAFNNQTVVSPRMTISFTPNWQRELNDTVSVQKNLTLRLSTGFYYQPPFYREMRNFAGELNKDIKAQQSIHFVLGADYGLRLWDRPFKLTGEAFYKTYTNLIPYELENVRLRYYATNNSKGFARGADFKLNGEFVPGIESWASISFLRTKEDLVDDSYYNYYNKSGNQIYSYTYDKVATDSTLNNPGYIPRPTDQLVSFGLFFQDEMPKVKGFKVNMNLIYATGLPYGPPTYERYKDTLRTPSYKRVDIGFMKELITPSRPGKGLFKDFKEAYISLEVFNLLQISNTISYQWIKDVNGTQYSVPNYLTARRVNLKLILRF